MNPSRLPQIDLVGQCFGRLTVVKYAGVKIYGKDKRQHSWRCVCDCGKSITVIGISLRNGDTKSCGCFRLERLHKRQRDFSGKRFGMLLAIERLSNNKWKCICDCGNITSIARGNIGKTKSCGCLKRKSRNATHGQSRTKMYGIYRAMLGRCYNKNQKAYLRYGGRGITVCERWRGKGGFENFRNDMGKRPSAKHSIERKKNNEGYSPENCRWATQKEQCSNTRRNVFVVVGGNEVTMAEAARLLGISRSSVKRRLDRGLPIETPLQKAGRALVK